jgi:putative flippase GtrA
VTADAAPPGHYRRQFVDRVPPGLRQFIKFAIVGGTGTIVNLIIFSLIIAIYGHAHGDRSLLVEQIASGVAFCVAVVNNFVLNRRWTFHHEGPIIPHFGRFFVVSLLGLGLNVFSYTLFHHWLGIEEHVSQFLANCVVTPFNFVGSKLWAFK